METKIAVACVIERGGDVLLVRKPRGLGPYPDTWHIPGGKISRGESIKDALKREIKEETGLDISNIEQISFDEDIEPDKHGKPTHFIFLQFRAEARREATADDDIEKVLWVSKDKLSDYSLNKPTSKLFHRIGLI